MSVEKRSFGVRVNSWLQEAAHEQFKDNKWRFWWPALIGFQVLNAILTAVIFGTDGNLQQFMGGIILALGALLSWLGLGALFYSDGPNRQLARSVAALDSVTLLFAAAHFCFLLWALGHLYTLRGAETKYELAAATYNAKAEKVSGDKVAIALAQRDIAKEQTKQAKLENDSAYQLRRAAEAGGLARPAGRRPGSTEASRSGGPTLDTSAPELERPVKPEKTSAAFLNEWDGYIRGANFGELALAILTLIVIRNVSAKSNAAPASAPDMNFNPLSSVANRTPAPRPALKSKTTTPGDIVDDTGNQQKTTQGVKHPGLRVLRECLKSIAFANPPGHFKVDLKPDYLIIRFMESRRGDEATKYSVRVRLAILDDGLSMPAEAYRARVERLLRQNGFFEDREDG